MGRIQRIGVLVLGLGIQPVRRHFVFEHSKQPLASRAVFLRRLLRFGSFAFGIILVSLGIGILGYHFIVGLSWIDSLLNASMLLGGMGPIDIDLKTTGA